MIVFFLLTLFLTSPHTSPDRTDRPAQPEGFRVEAPRASYIPTMPPEGEGGGALGRDARALSHPWKESAMTHKDKLSQRSLIREDIFS